MPRVARKGCLRLEQQELVHAYAPQAVLGAAPVPPGERSVQQADSRRPPHSGDMKTQQPGIDARIVGIGAYRPRRILSNEELTARTDRSDDWIRRRTGNHGNADTRSLTRR